MKRKQLLRLFALFMFISFLSITLAGWMDAKKIDHRVVLGANILLFLLALLNLLIQTKALRSSNPNVFTRSVMGGTFIKLFAILIAVFVYAFVAGQNRSLYAIFIGMGLYILYTIVEVSSALELNKVKNGSN